MVFILLLLTLLSVQRAGHSHAFSLTNYLCNNSISYGLNSSYHSKIIALGFLSDHESNSTVGRAPDQVRGLAPGRSDVKGTSCASCLALAPDVAFGNCRGVKDLSIVYDRCLLQNSGKDFLTNPDDLFDPLSSWEAYHSTSRYAAGVMTSDEGFVTTEYDLVHNIYGLVQCTPDQAPQTCQGCLCKLEDEMPAVLKTAELVHSGVTSDVRCTFSTKAAKWRPLSRCLLRRRLFRFQQVWLAGMGCRPPLGLASTAS